MSDSDLIVIVGAGLAGVSAADALREAGHGGPVVLLSDEKNPPYDRPPLSKGILQGTADMQDIQLKPEGWYEENRIELMLGTAASRIDPRRKEILLDDGTSLAFQKLLLATGSEVRHIPSLETGETPFFYLRTDLDAIALRAALEPDTHVVLVGAGVIGLEVAASAVQRGCKVTVLEIADRVMARSVPPDISAWIQVQHESRGVNFRTLQQVSGHSQDPRTPGLLMANGDVIEADFVVIGAGIVPNTELGRECGLACGDGITVNEYGETSAADIYAAGDVAWYPDYWAGRHMRSENWFHAEKHARCVARNMLGEQVAYEEIQTMWSDQYDFKLQVAGALEGDQEVVRGEPDSGHFMVFYLREGAVVGALGINQSKYMRIVQNMIRARRPADTAALADPDANLKKAML